VQIIKVKNPQTGEIEEIGVDESMKTDLGGGSTPETETKRMAKEKGYQVLAEIVNPQDGESHFIDESELNAAYKKGYKTKLEYDLPKEREPVGAWEAAGYGAAKFATMGAAPAFGGVAEWLGGGSFKEGMEKYKERQEQAYQEHPASYGAGAALPIGVGLFAQGAPLAAQAAVGAAPPVVEQLATKEQTPENWKQTAKEAAIGGGLSLGLGAALGTMAPKIAKGAQGASERRAVKAIGGDVLAPTRRTQRMPGGVQAMGRDLMDLGIVEAGSNVEKM
jgi:hypothetical protein